MYALNMKNVTFDDAGCESLKAQLCIVREANPLCKYIPEAKRKQRVSYLVREKECREN